VVGRWTKKDAFFPPKILPGGKIGVGCFVGTLEEVWDRLKRKDRPYAEEHYKAALREIEKKIEKEMKKSVVKKVLTYFSK